ncbi:AzlC family ABC transporter permease [Tannockella kyphosi]|uniref:AzlC family ABC transporter permease n=1 Tax=Tannockella kyphosi TaxID=2899121 RepID=UPI002012D374|nr:AzlC family ABC transporter permease [Tannockella kyphosi]
MKTKALKAALPYTLPICIGFLFIGLSYGFLMSSLGFSFIYPMITSFLIFAGAMEFVTANLLLMAFNPLQAFLLAVMVNARHIFYGISMLDKYKGTGWKKFYLIFGMCDESFSINCTVQIPEDIDKGWFMFFVTLFNHFYWVLGATLGGILGTVVSFDTTGIEFVLTALFVVMFVEQWKETKEHFPACVGLLCALGSLFLFGGDSFMLPAMFLIVISFGITKLITKGEVK